MTLWTLALFPSAQDQASCRSSSPMRKRSCSHPVGGLNDYRNYIPSDLVIDDIDVKDAPFR